MKGRLTKILTTRIAKFNQKTFIKKIDFDNIFSSRLSNISIHTLCGEKQSIDLLYSILSFFSANGKPLKWVIYDDGTLTNDTKCNLQRIPDIQIKSLKDINPFLPKEILDLYPTLWKIEIMCSQIHSTTSMFSDSDIVYFSSFESKGIDVYKENYYLIDEGMGYFDSSYYSFRKKQFPPLNLGCIILNHFKLDWSPIFNYIIRLYKNGLLSYWSDQTAMDQFAIENHFKALPSEYFVVGGNDSFKVNHCCDYDKIALRHFVGPVRHKMWQYSWKKVLGV